MPDTILAELDGDTVDLTATAERGRIVLSWSDAHAADALVLSPADARRLMYQLSCAHVAAQAPEAVAC